MVRNIRIKRICPTAARANASVAVPVAAMTIPPIAGPVIAAS
jgi:hypothetical protein